MNVYTYKVEFETDKSGMIVVSLPTLNYTADCGKTVEEALRNLKKLATGFIETLLDEGENPPPSDIPGSGVYLSIEIKRHLATHR